ncbi:Alpha/Beta hydrolase protein [Rhizoctonia solani]|nr:Alpha/Beta hydrolase protein [Rhizoctonia solani]
MFHLAATLFSLSLVVLPPVWATGPVIHGANGLSYVGLRNATSRQDYFLGIPFALPPVGPLRFKPPVAWTPGEISEVNATQYGASCEQSIPSTTNNTISEDCLTLNIWKPTDVAGKIPVMVYIYGGGFYGGESVAYPGTSLVERASKIGKPIVYITINYRLGIYGFPPGQAAYNAGGRNLGFKDQRLALEWIQENVQYFGGDPNKVTIFGTSAGAISAGVQAFYNNGKIGELFQGMILESGSPETIRAFKPNDPIREATFQFVVNATGCLNDPSPFECVRNAPADVLSQANGDVLMLEPAYRAIGKSPTTFGPTYAPEDDFVTKPIHELLHSGEFAKVPFINGVQLDEGTLFVDGPTTNIRSDQDIINWLTACFPGLYFGISNVTAVKELLKLYPTSPAAGSPYGTGSETFGRSEQYKRFASLFGDFAFQAPRRDHLDSATRFGVKSWSYILKESPLTYPPAYGIGHGGDLPFVMQTLNIQHPNASSEAVELMETIGYYWINFAYSLNPNAGGHKRPHWPQYGKARNTLQLLGSNVVPFKDTARIKATEFINQGHGLF